jgi:hypothetical protein
MNMDKLFLEDREAWVEKNIEHLENGRLNEIDRVNMIVALAEMAYGRNRSMSVLENLQDKICEHILLICALPNAQETNHWIGELESWRKKLSIINKNPKQKRPIYSSSLLQKKFWEEPFSEDGDVEYFFKIMNKPYPDLKQAIDDGIDKKRLKEFIFAFVKSIISDGEDTAKIFKQWKNA